MMTTVLPRSNSCIIYTYIYIYTAILVYIYIYSIFGYRSPQGPFFYFAMKRHMKRLLSKVRSARALLNFEAPQRTLTDSHVFGVLIDCHPMLSSLEAQILQVMPGPCHPYVKGLLRNPGQPQQLGSHRFLKLVLSEPHPQTAPRHHSFLCLDLHTIASSPG